MIVLNCTNKIYKTHHTVLSRAEREVIRMIEQTKETFVERQITHIDLNLFILKICRNSEGSSNYLIKSSIFPETLEFQGLGSAILAMERAMDCSSENLHTFTKRKKMEQENTESYRHQADISQFTKNTKNTETFFINVYYRQHNSWQGEVQWIRGKQKRYFRSVLELIHLICSVIS